MIDALAKGDEVVTAGGMLGQVSQARRELRGRRGRQRRRAAGAAHRRGAGAAQGHVQVSACRAIALTDAVRRCAAPPATRSRPAVKEVVMNRYPLWKYAILRGRAAGRAALHAAQLLRRGAGGAGQQRQGHAEGRRRASCRASSRRSAQAGLQGRLRAVRRQLGEGALRRHRHPAQGQGRDRQGAQPRPGRPALHRRAEPAVALAALADRAARAADVPGPGPARRRALPDAGRHEGGADQEGRGADRRHPHAAARQEHAPRRHHARRQRRRRALPRPRDADRRARPAGRPVARPAVDRGAPTAATSSSTGSLKPEAARARAGHGAQAEHHHAAQPRQRTRRGRAGDPAAGRWTASWCSCPACRTPPRPRTSSAAPPRWRCAWSTRAPRPPRPRRAPARCPSAPSATSSAAAGR